MNDKQLQFILRWGEEAIRIAMSGKQESSHIDVLLCDFYLKETAVDDCLAVMDYLVESYASECLSKKITILAIIPLKYRKRMSIIPPAAMSLVGHLSETPPEIYFLPKNTDIGCVLDGEDYTCFYPLNTEMNKKYKKKQLFSFYRCWRARDSIENNWVEYERDIYRVFDPSGELLWGTNESEK